MADKHSKAPRAQVATVQIGTVELEGIMTQSGEFFVAVSQISDLFSIPNKNVSRDVKALLGNDFQFYKIASELNPKPVNAISLNDFGLAAYRFSVVGKDVSGKATAFARAYYSRECDTEKLSVLDGLRALEKSNYKALKSRTVSQRERDLQEKFAVLWGCEKEYPVEYHRTGSITSPPVFIGRADLVSDRRLVEIKDCRQWKHAMGQLLAYQEILQRPEIWLILFKAKEFPRREIESIVSRFGIKVKFIRN